MGTDPPGPSDRSALIARLDSFVEFPGTIVLFDVLSGPDAGDLPLRLGAVVARFPAHPLGPELREWLKANGASVPPPDPLAVLAELGIDDVRTWATQRKRERDELQRALEEAREGRMSASLAANGYSFVCVLLFLVALMGWGAAFHVWEFTPEPALPGPGAKPPKQEVVPQTG